MIEDPLERPSGLRALAERHGVSLEAARHMLRALETGGGTMAQFDHPEFGGMGQWFSGGMVMVGRMNDHALKARVSALCDDLSAALPASGWRSGASASAASSGGFSSQSQSSGGFGGARGFEAGRWWPEGLGRPASVGAQNATRYAYFPETRRLAVETNGRLALYDTAEHVVTGASQQQGGTSAFVFTGPRGTVPLEALERVDLPEAGKAAPAEADPPRTETVEEPGPPDPPRAAASSAAAAAGPAAMPGPATASPSAAGAAGDVLSTLERLAELHRKGVLTDAEFSGKKAELLARL